MIPYSTGSSHFVAPSSGTGHGFQQAPCGFYRLTWVSMANGGFHDSGGIILHIPYFFASGVISLAALLFLPILANAKPRPDDRELFPE